MERLGWLPGGDIATWSALIAMAGVVARLTPKTLRGFATLFVASALLMIKDREIAILRATVNKLMEEREKSLGIFSESTSAGGTDSSPGSPEKTSIRILKPSEPSNESIA